jgi:transcriptional regulator with GAF, ATPase, and Fis domain
MRTIPADVRVVAASNVNLEGEVRAGRFRQDLYFRLCVFPIVIPPLRDRRDDIPMLIDHFLRIFRERHHRNVVGLSRRAIDALLAYDFPGNIRELQNLIERGVIFAEPGGLIDIQHLFTGGEASPTFPQALSQDGRIKPKDVLAAASHPGPIASPDDLAAAEDALYREALRAAAGNVSAAARGLGLTRPKLEYRLRKLGLIN